MESIIDSIIQEKEGYGLLEIIAVATAIIYIVLATKSNRWCFLFGLISSVIYVYLATSLKFYFDSAINSYYVFMSFYGWFAWSKNKKQEKNEIRWMKKKNLIGLLITSSLVTIILAFVANQLSDASLPYLDSFTTTFAILATWMVVKKYIENWLIWIAVDAVAAGMYFNKGLVLTALLFVAYTIIVIFGYFKWKKQIA